jgi:hypothetical protein
MQGVGVEVGVGVGLAVAVAVGVGEAVGLGPASSLSVKASCWELPPISTRPSTHEETCLLAIAEP